MPPRIPLSSLPRLPPSSLPGRRVIQPTTTTSSASLSTTATAGSAPDSHGSTAAAEHHHDDHHGEWYESDASQQWFMGVPPNEKYKKEGWENVTYWGLGGGVVAAMVAYAYKPDSSIQTWALEEARRRLEKEGILADPDDVAKKS